MADPDPWRALENLLQRHFASVAPTADYGYEAYWIVHTIFSQEHALNHAGVEDVKRVVRCRDALREFTNARIQLSDYAWDALVSIALRRVHEASDLGERIKTDAEENAWRASLANDPVYQFLSGQYDFVEQIDLVLCELEQSIIDTTTEKEKQTNELGIKAIDACRIQWWRLTGKVPARKGISRPRPGGNSSFTKYAHDIWDQLGIDGDCQSAFNAWAGRFAADDPLARYSKT